MSEDVKPRYKPCYVGAPAIFLLELECKLINKAFKDVAYCYLVGSCLEKPDWRDVDVRCLMDDAVFDTLFPNTRDGVSWEIDHRWLLINTSLALTLKHKTGLPIDFQIHPITWANKRYPHQPRDALGM
jgi:hypothetical protein